MALAPGTRFGSYEIVDQIGSGGMGVVWRATDTELNRDVAVKVLPQAFADDADRLARFQREAEILASLNHPNIAQVYGLEKSDGQTAIVMELVEGPTLADRIADGPIPPDEAMGIALQIIGALEAAHDRHIVHRDLKPANVKVRDDGTVKVLDFGISKPIDPAAISGGSPVMTTPAVTQTGVILGTAAYMSPEQARGKFVDQRTDIWAFGCLLFEMLTGQPVFGGEDVMLTLARVLDRDADLKSIPQTISPAVRHTLKLCLEKDLRKRIADIRDVRLALAGTFETESEAAAAMSAVQAPIWKRALPHAAVAALAGAIVFVITVGLEDPPPAEPALVTKFIHELPDGMSFNRTARVVVAVSPRGDRIAYGADEGLFVREIDELEGTLIASTAGQRPRSPVFSPDGQWITYMTGTSALWRVSLLGGSPQFLTELAEATDGPSYTPDGAAIIYEQQSDIMIVPATGGQGEVLVSIDAGELHHPTLLPGGQYLLASLTGGEQASESEVVLINTATSDLQPLFSGRRPRYVDPGYIVYFDDGNIIARAFDLEALGVPGAEVSGGPVEIERGVELLGAWPAPQFELSASGTLVYMEDADGESGDPVGGGEMGLATVDAAGDVAPLDVPLRRYSAPSVSPNGRYLAVTVEDDDESTDIWLYELGGNSEIQPITFGGDAHDPAWRDDETVLFVSDSDGSSGIWQQRVDGGRAEPLMTAEPGVQIRWPAWARDDDRLIFSASDSGDMDLYAMSLPDGEPVPIVSRPGNQQRAAFSADGRVMAYFHVEGGLSRGGGGGGGGGNVAFEIHVSPYPPNESYRRVSQEDVMSSAPVFMQRDGNLRLVYQVADSGIIEAVNISFPEFQPSNRQPIASYGAFDNNALRPAVASIPGTEEFVITWSQNQSNAVALSSENFAGQVYFGRLVVIENFTELVKQRFQSLRASP